MSKQILSVKERKAQVNYKQAGLRCCKNCGHFQSEKYQYDPGFNKYPVERSRKLRCSMLGCVVKKLDSCDSFKEEAQ